MLVGCQWFQICCVCVWCFLTSPKYFAHARLKYCPATIDWGRVLMKQMPKRLLKWPAKPLLLINRRKYRKMFIHKSEHFAHSWMKFFFQMKRWWMTPLDYLNKEAFFLAEVGLVLLWEGVIHLLIILVSTPPLFWLPFAIVFSFMKLLFLSINTVIWGFLFYLECEWKEPWELASSKEQLCLFKTDIFDT